MENQVAAEEPIVVKKKRGRKPSGKKKFYFGEEEEIAFQEFITCSDPVERDMIFNRRLYPAFCKLVESIIRTYTLFVPLEDYEETFHDTMSFLISKINNFDVTKGYKLYSYCGTVCKNYLMLKRNQFKKKQERQISYDKMYPTSEKDERIDDNDTKTLMLFNNELINNTISKIQDILSNENVLKLNENEQKIGYALLEMLMNWEEIFNRLENRKFNKTSVWYFLKEYTLLSSKEIREGMKKYKDLYFITKENMISE